MFTPVKRKAYFMGALLLYFPSFNHKSQILPLLSEISANLRKYPDEMKAVGNDRNHARKRNRD